jgi:hypothetical protein
MNTELNTSNPTALPPFAAGEPESETPPTTAGGTNWSRLLGWAMPLRLCLLAGVAGLALLWCALELLGSRARSVQAGATEIAVAAQDTAKAVESAGQVLSGVFGGQVSISNEGIIQMPQEIAELATLEHEITLTSRYTREMAFGWFPSSLVLIGRHRGRFGIDLEKVTGQFDPDTLILELELPPAKLLTVECLGIERTHQGEWWVNRIETEDAVHLVRQNFTAARSELAQADLLRRAERNLLQRLYAATSSAGVLLRIQEPGAPMD